MTLITDISRWTLLVNPYAMVLSCPVLCTLGSFPFVLPVWVATACAGLHVVFSRAEQAFRGLSSGKGIWSKSKAEV